MAEELPVYISAYQANLGHFTGVYDDKNMSPSDYALNSRPCQTGKHFCLIDAWVWLKKEHSKQ